MLGQSLFGGRTSSPAKNRIFVYEVTGLRQNTQNDRNGYPFRNSSNVFIQVPYSRMNEEMLRITRMGGSIVNIKPLGASESSESNDSEAVDENNE